MRKTIATAFMAAALAASAAGFISPSGSVSATLGDDGFAVYSLGQQVFTIPSYGLGEGSFDLDSVSGPEHQCYCYDMATGKKSHCHNHANSYTLSFSDGQGGGYAMELALADDGFAFRYLGAQAEEKTAYHIPEGAERYMQRWTEAYEEFFPMADTGESKESHWGYPALVKAKGGDRWALITEAGIERWHSASSLCNDGEPRTDYRVVPAACDKEYSGVWSTPWRVAIIGSLADIVESTLVADLSPAAVSGDYSWVAPGSVSWVYWANNHGSNDYQIIKKYVDMAAEIGLPYVLIDAEWDEMGNGGDINDAIAYADSRGVGVLVWYNSSTGWLQKDGSPGPHFRLNNPADREREFAWLESKGVKGVKIDFFQGDLQSCMGYCIDLLECAAKHHLMVNFHGATIPRGWQRTYPNLMSVEGVYGAEWYNNKPVLTSRAAAHNATLPFTRNVVGPMDYTPCAFSDSQHPHITTNAHELALAVLFESALQHWADRPESYLAQPAQVRAFMAELPTAWDETRLLAGYPADYAAIARRKGDAWYIGVINGRDEACAVEVPWHLIGGQWQAVVFADNGRPVDASKYGVDTWDISQGAVDLAAMPAQLRLQPRGGCVFVLKPL